MMKKMILLAMAVTALVALAGPAAASANWTDNHSVITSGNNPTISFDGTAQFASATAEVHCTGVTGRLEATGGTTDGHLREFTVDTPTTNCDVSRSVGELCGTHSLERVGLKAGNVPTATVAGGKITITKIELENEFVKAGGGACLVLLLTDEGGVTATPDNTATINDVTLGGFLKAGGFGKVAVGGTLTVTPAGRYGIE
jgi:hypothetical protein